MKVIRLTVLVCILFSIGCKLQKKEKMNSINYKEKFINLYKKVKKKPEPPVFIYSFDFRNVYIEMYVNDKLFLKSYSYVDAIQDNHFINSYFNNKQNQKIKILMKPLMDNYFDEQSFFRLTLISLDRKTYYDEDTWGGKKNILDYTSNEFARDSTGDFARDSTGSVIGYIKEKKLDGKPYFEKEFEFEAKLPFKLPNLEETSKDLRELDEVTLKKEVLTYLNRFINSVNNSNDEVFFWEAMYNKVYLDCIANYRTAEEINELYENAELVFSDKRATFLPIKDYEMVFYDNGRLVTLESTSSDNKKKGKSVLNLEFKQEGKKIQESNKMNFYFHIPKGSKELEVIY
ncbi:hypothetical protein LNI89_11785 [Tenacibaculum dicentrarchi]|uniref:hypothetical protein n=1 Tax=Tenacibaculum dicentrarchi TaxID=669041 RepID=UPI001BE6BFCF|nr:hypothetical protein [Tenacibaculum dicentrarchi]MCD8421156.1 hypothetical protein [Tenacibaculum dicentrarchi]